MSKISRLFPCLLILYEFCANMSNDMYLPALSLIAQNFQVQIHQVQLTITTWLAGSMAVQLIVGPLADHYGRRRVLFLGGILFLLATLACSFSPSLPWLILFRFFQGMGVCSMMVTGYASIHDLYDDKKAIPILVWMGSAAIIAPAIGPVLGGLVLLLTSWRNIFFSLFLLASSSLLGLWWAMPESAKINKKIPFKIKNLLLSYSRIIKNVPFMISSFSFALGYGGIMGWITASPFLLMGNLGLTPTEFGYWQIPIFGGYIVGAQLVKSLIDRFDKKQLIRLGLAVSGFSGFLLLFLSFKFSFNLLSFILPMTLYSLGFGFAAAPLNRITMTATKEPKGVAMAVFYTCMALSGTVISLGVSLLQEHIFPSCFLISLPIFGSFMLYNVLKKVF